jgi:hypothetical protein
MNWLADDDPVTIKALNDGHIVDFFILLDEKIRKAKQQIKRIQKTKK